MSLLSKQPLEATKIKQIEKSIYQPHKSLHCQQHHLPKQLTCLSSQCPLNYHLICRDCHPIPNHPLISVHRIVPKLSQLLRDEWALIMKQHKTIENQWKHCLVNINYCLDILNQIKSQILERSQKVSFHIFNQVLGQVYGMFHHQGENISLQGMLKRFQHINQKYHLLEAQDKAPTCQAAEHQRNHHKHQVRQVSHKTKNFSESALAFSGELAAIIEEKLKFEKRVGRLKQLSQVRIFTLKDLIKEDEGKLEEVGEVMIEVGKKKEEQGDTDIGQLLGKCSNLKSLRISSKSNGGVEKQKWKRVVYGMEYLKFLKELILNVRGCDLPFLTQLFKQKNKAVRQIQKLSLTITDQKQLNVQDVCAFVNTMELRSLHLTLTRDNLDRTQIVYLIQNLRLSTTMSGLPLSQLILNLSRNKIKDGKDISDINLLFNSQAAKVKQRSLTL